MRSGVICLKGNRERCPDYPSNRVADSFDKCHCIDAGRRRTGDEAKSVDLPEQRSILLGLEIKLCTMLDIVVFLTFPAEWKRFFIDNNYFERNMEMKKTISTILAVIIVLSVFITPVLAAGNTTTANTPANENEAALFFKTQVRAADSWDGLSNTAAIGSDVFVAVGNILKKIDALGNETGSLELAGNVSSSPFITVGDGKVFVFVSDGVNGYLQAIDAQTLEQVAISSAFEGMESFSPVLYENGRIYAPLSGYDYASWTVEPGVIACLEYSQGGLVTKYIYDAGLSYYWNGTAAAGDLLITAASEGKIQVLDKDTGVLVSEKDIEEVIKTSVVYSDGNIYFGTGAGHAVKLSVAGSGIIEESSLLLLDLGSQVTTTPVINNSRMYLGTGDFTGGTGFYVVDVLDMSVIYKTEISGIDSWSGAAIASTGIQSSPLLSIIDDNDVCIYFTINAKPGSLYALLDSPSAAEADVRELFVPEEADQNSSISPIVANSEGTIYYTNDSGILFAIGKTAPAPTPAPETSDTDIVSYMILTMISFAVLLIIIKKKQDISHEK